MWDKIDKWLWGLVVVLAVIGGTVLILRFGFGGSEDTWLCKNDQWVKHGNPSALMPDVPCISSDNQNVEEGSDTDAADGGVIEWSEALRLIRSCEVVRVGQGHNKSVDLWLKDGQQVWTTEPELDDVIEAAQSAEDTCGAIPISTE